METVNTPVPVANGTAAKTKDSRITTILAMADILVRPEWNARSGNWQVAENAEATSGRGNDFTDLKNSISEEGQDQACVVRLNETGKGPKYDLVVGFRRFEAMRALAKDGKSIPNLPGWNPNRPVIRAEIREMVEAEARALNMRENTSRDDLKGSDLAWGVAQMIETGIAGTKIAERLGKNQSYISALRQIFKGVGHAGIDRWRSDNVQIGYLDMMRVAKEGTKIEQDALYQELRAKKAGKVEGQGPQKAAPGMAWFERAKKEAGALGKVMGNLVRLGHLNKPSHGVRFTEKLVRAHVKFKTDIVKDDKVLEGATANQVSAIVDQATLEYKAALNYEEPEGDEDGDENEE